MSTANNDCSQDLRLAERAPKLKTAETTGAASVLYVSPRSFAVSFRTSFRHVRTAARWLSDRCSVSPAKLGDEPVRDSPTPNRQHKLSVRSQNARSAE